MGHSPLAGGNWDNGVYAGSRAVNVNNVPWNVNVNIGSRFACDFVMKLDCYLNADSNSDKRVRGYSPAIMANERRLRRLRLPQ